MSADDAVLHAVALTFHRVCECGSPMCIDCRSWVTESNVPFHMEGPIIPAIANTAGVDTLRLIHQKYTIVTVVAGSFDPFVVLQSIKENVVGIGPLNRITGLRGHLPTQPPVSQPQSTHPASPVTLADPVVAELLGRCVGALEETARILDDGQASVMELDDDTIVYDGRRYLQVHPKPTGRSRFRAMLIRWLVG